MIDSRTLRPSPETGTRSGYDRAKRQNGFKLQMAVDTLGNLLALRLTPDNLDEPTEVAGLLQTVQAVTEGSVMWPLPIRGMRANSQPKPLPRKAWN